MMSAMLFQFSVSAGGMAVRAWQYQEGPSVGPAESGDRFWVDRPGEMLIAQIYLEESFRGQDIDGQAAVPQRDAQLQLLSLIHI